MGGEKEGMTGDRLAQIAWLLTNGNTKRWPEMGRALTELYDEVMRLKTENQALRNLLERELKREE